MKPKKKKFTYGTCAFSRISPDPIQPTSKALNVVVSFDEALKLNIAIDECCRELNSYDRSTKAGRDAALNLTIFFDSNRIAVNEEKVK